MFYCKKYDKTPGSPLYLLFRFLLRIFFFRIKKAEYDDKLLSEAQKPFIILSNHESFYDFYYILRMIKGSRPNALINEYYTKLPVLRMFALRCGVLPKKLFTREVSTVLRINNMLKKGYPVIIFPEGRLTPDGRTSKIIKSGAAFYRRLKYDLVLVKIDGAYYSSPKWRKRYYPSKVKVSVEKVIHSDELKKMTDESLEEIICSSLKNDASKCELAKYEQKDKAEGLEGVLFRCVFCNKKYKMLGKGNDLLCEACGKKLTIDENYHFTEWPYTIPAYYDAIVEEEKKEIDTLNLRMEVTLKVFGENGGIVKKEDGECIMNKNVFIYRSLSEEFEIPVKEFDGMAFSCSKEIEFYRGEELYFFYPKKDRQQVAQWALFIDLMSDRRGGA
ncbi:MAG: 1-acyl-sn-glycerol-3-phosphate acyltransferase [Lachnospiraceae bacterium]|nr:1-acyl-sn-glycerol-3-phosphate acyltransferase [Lachnospiraceae bacterium]